MSVQTIFISLMGALILILASLFPPLGAFFNSLPQAVLGGCTVMMFGSIMYEGIKMLKECEFDDRTMVFGILYRSWTDTDIRELFCGISEGSWRYL